MEKKGAKGAVDRKYTTITIPKPLFEKLEKQISDTGFSSVSDYITYVLRELVSELNEKEATSKTKEGVIRKLRSLGYMG